MGKYCVPVDFFPVWDLTTLVLDTLRKNLENDIW